MGRMGRTAVLSGNWYVFYWRTAMRVLIISRAPCRLQVVGFGYASPPLQRQHGVPARPLAPERSEATAPMNPSWDIPTDLGPG